MRMGSVAVSSVVLPFISAAARSLSLQYIFVRLWSRISTDPTNNRLFFFGESTAGRVISRTV